ncbi:MAG: LPS export ABC transporter ATP-binding protein [Bacteroidetes bacterium]|nr:LPS export ABC transporter ATP-binding protein [Bacteroidota bacterium]
MTLRSEHLVKTYGKRTVVNDVSVHVSQGEIVGLLGPNGAGKTTSFYQIVGLIPPDTGKVFLGDTDITDLPMYKRAQAGVGYLPQEASVFRNLSVEDNVAAVLEMTKLSKKEQKEKLELLLAEFGLNRVRKSMGNVLSGGERRRTEIARALATDPKFILLDEPFAGIDPIAVEDIQRIVVKLKEKNIGVLITDHNVQETLSITDRAYLLFEGKILKAGNAEELANDPQVRKVYLGENFILHRKNYASDSGNVKGVTKEEMIAYTNQMVKQIEQLLSSVKDGNTRESEDLVFKKDHSDFRSTLNEYKLSLSNFAATSADANLIEKANELTSNKNTAKSGVGIKDMAISAVSLVIPAVGNMLNTLDQNKDLEAALMDERTALQHIVGALMLLDSNKN